MASTSPSFSVASTKVAASSVYQKDEAASNVYQKDEMPTIQFTTVQDLFEKVRQVEDDILIVKGVPLSVFEDLNLKERRPFRIRRYDVKQRLLILTIPTELHEALHLYLFRALDHQFVRNNQARDWKLIGSTTFRPKGHPRGDGGEGDSSGGPKEMRSIKGSWPTLVIKSGKSQSLSTLHNDMRWWFSASNHDVKIVLLCQFNQPGQRITIQRWEEERPIRQGATNTRRHTIGLALQPVLRQNIEIIRDRTNGSYHVTSGALILPFRLLFLRDPGPQEGDYIIGIQELEEYAGDVWLSV